MPRGARRHRAPADERKLATVLFADIAATRLDALAMLRRVDCVEGQALSLSQPGSYLEPFALRALGIVRDDAALLARSGELFATLGLDWHAAQTDALAA